MAAPESKRVRDVPVRFYKITDTVTGADVYTSIHGIAAIVDNGTLITIRMAIDSPGSGNQSAPVTIDLDAENSAFFRSIFDSSWSFHVEGQFNTT